MEQGELVKEFSVSLKTYNFHYVKTKSNNICIFPAMEPSHRKHASLLDIYLSEKLSWDNHLSFVLQKANQKLAYLKRTIPIESKLSVKCNLVKAYII